MQRTLVSYDDISTPLPASSTPSTSTAPGPRAGPSRPPKKRRRQNHNHSSGHNLGAHVQHWDEPPRPSEHVAYGDSSGATNARDESAMEESRELTHEEIWDDSALVETWNAAMEEYEVMNGPGKGWKKEPVHKSPLWYNVPRSSKPTLPTGASSAEPPSGADGVDNDGADSTPLDFATFVPTHDPSLSLPTPNAAGDAAVFPAAPSTLVSRDDAFQNALGAMYWAGYWTAAYHYSREGGAGGAEEAGQEEEDEEPEEEEVEDLVSTQR